MLLGGAGPAWKCSAWRCRTGLKPLDLVGGNVRAQEHLAQLYEEVRQYAGAGGAAAAAGRSPRTFARSLVGGGTPDSTKSTQLREVVNGCIPQCEVDRFAIGQVFRNVLENAGLDVVPNQSEITIECDEIRGAVGPLVRVAIRDQGPGLTPEQRAHILEPFFTTKTKGTGLGMAIAHRIVQAHSGQIDVGNCSGTGAEIVVSLPKGNI